ncbi:MAG TPA: lamin tail domain-containing protein [Candidatus Eisenbacteria bacterium]
MQALLSGLILVACAPPLRPIIAEIFYDAVGDDTGHEFVELFNPHPVALPLAGVRLEAGDGSGPGRWSLRWTGTAGDSVGPNRRFVIGGAQVPMVDASVTLDLQNGPDAVRLVWPDGGVERVGYGVHEFPEYACGSPAVDAPSGQSLARIPDAADQGSNAVDFRVATPSPGRANQPMRDLALIGGSLQLDPEQPAADARARLRGALVNRGATAVEAGAATLRGSEARAGGSLELFLAAIDRSLASGDTAAFDVEIGGLAAGRHTITVRLELAGDESPDNDSDSLWVRAGPGPLGITEIQFHPSSGEGEWVEVRNQLGVPLEVAGFSIADRHGTPGLVPGAGRLEPESLAVLAQDRAALLLRYPGLDTLRVWAASPWPSLNNTNDSSGAADLVVLREADGTSSDQVEYSAAGVPPGVPLERGGDGSWSASTEPAGSPLRPPRPLLPLAGPFEVEPRRFTAGSGRGRLAWALPWARARIAIDAYDLSGRRVAPIWPETSVAGRGETTWQLAELPAGLYLIVMRARVESGTETLAHGRAIRVEGSAP